MVVMPPKASTGCFKDEWAKWHVTQFLAFETFRRSRKPNDFLAAPPGLTRAKADMVTPEYRLSPQELFDAVVSDLGTEGSFQDIKTDPENTQLHAVAVTRLLRFKDDFYVRVLGVESGSTLAIYSHSRIGGGDLGANRKRVLRFLDRLNQPHAT